MYRNYIKVFVLCFMLLFAFSIEAQQVKSFWGKISDRQNPVADKAFRKTEPNSAAFFNLELDNLTGLLEAAQNKNSNVLASGNTIVRFPTGENTYKTFKIQEASILHPDLQKKYNAIKSYKGYAIENPSSTIRFSITPQGLHAIMFATERGTLFIDPYSNSEHKYIVYSKRDLPTLNTAFVCGVIDDVTAVESAELASRNPNDGVFRDFRLAIATTVEYSAFHVNAAGATGGTDAERKAAVLAAMVVTMTRVNGIYERDLSMTMTFVANNDELIFLDTDNFTNNNSNTLINESQTEIDNIIGFSNYDIGHTFSTGGGGLAQLNSPCTGNKARGITGLESPVGDAYDIDFVAHEIGHQFGSPHTFNGNAENCAGGNRSSNNAYEPGSGTTIMAYAGICGNQNVQANSDAYFHQRSIDLIFDNIFSGNSTCGIQTVSGNTAPIPDAGSDFIIPISTPYKLVGASTDVDGIASHTYTWEQFDLGASGVPSETTATGPMVRSFEGTANNTRFVPRLDDLVLTGGSTTWEFLPAIDRDQTFALTVRDNDPRGGQTNVDEMTVTTSMDSGPFIVTSQATEETWNGGDTQTITWDVANTDTGSVAELNVNILIYNQTTDKFITLVTSTPNDGSEVITVPHSDITIGRISVEASNNIFFALNSANLIVIPTSDMDGDGIFDADDNCPLTANADQVDTDNDGIGDVCDGDDDGDGVADAIDNCPLKANANQADINGNGIGDVCDDSDGDGVLDAIDNCPLTANVDQADLDADGIGDVCDADDDGDGIADAIDNCPLTANADQADMDGDGIGDACQDSDGDGVLDAVDNCPLTNNADQVDTDNDGMGDSCDGDDDGDGVLDAVDNCPLIANADQADIDNDGIGDSCDPDNDGDGILDTLDNCPSAANADQADFDNDGIGDLCDPDIDNDNVLNTDDICNDTPIGDTIDVNGCSIFTLEASNFQLIISSETCSSSDNGQVSITVVDTSLNYTANITGNGIDLTNMFTANTNFSNLTAGSYQVCISVDGQPTYVQCYNVTVTQPEDLTVFSQFDAATGLISLQLFGGDTYFISLNGIETTTTNTTVDLVSKSGVNRLIVKTDKDCQGDYREAITNILEMAVYPNPIENELFINTGDTSIDSADVSLYTILGEKIFINRYKLDNGRASINVSSLPSGIYLLKVNTGSEIGNFKIIKR